MKEPTVNITKEVLNLIAEIDEFKASKSPSLSKGFFLSLNDLGISDAYVIAPINESYKIKENVTILPLIDFINQFG